jgi:hypothetical protein
MKRSVLFFVATISLVALWWALFPDKYDRKNPHYVAWKYHLLPMEGSRAASIVAIDADRDRLVLGKTKEELQQRFGFVLTVDQVRPYLRVYCAATRPGKDVLFLNSNDLMVVMNQGRAVEIIVCKG